MQRTRTGELSIFAESVTTLAPSLYKFPDANAPRMAEEHCARWRHLHLLSDPNAMALFKKRSQIVGGVRSFFQRHSFIEVESPVLHAKCGGASARPFETVLGAGRVPLYLRISPELFLKQLIVGGFDRVFELGKVFRNEGVDATHNPEFTSVEVYQSFASLPQMIALTEGLLQGKSFAACPTSWLARSPHR